MLASSRCLLTPIPGPYAYIFPWRADAYSKRASVFVCRANRSVRTITHTQVQSIIDQHHRKDPSEGRSATKVRFQEEPGADDEARQQPSKTVSSTKIKTRRRRVRETDNEHAKTFRTNRRRARWRRTRTADRGRPATERSQERWGIPCRGRRPPTRPLRRWDRNDSFRRVGVRRNTNGEVGLFFFSFLFFITGTKTTWGECTRPWNWTKSSSVDQETPSWSYSTCRDRPKTPN